MSESSRARLRRTGLAIAGFGMALLFWHLLTTALATPGSLVARFSPGDAFPALVEFISTPRGQEHTVATLRRLLAGLGAAVLTGTLVGVAVGISRPASEATSGVFQFLRMVSPLAWTPVAIAVFGIGDAPVFFLVLVAAVWPVILSTAAGIEAVDPGWVAVARSLNANRLELVRAVYLPAIRVHIGTGIRLALGTAWIVIVPAEMLGVDSGLGYSVLDARDRLNYSELMGIIIWIGLLGTLLDTTVRRITRPRLDRSRRQPRKAVNGHTERLTSTSVGHGIRDQSTP